MNEATFAVALLESGLARCHEVITGEGGLLLTLLITGLIGSLTHCTGMCGPFVLSQTAARLESIPASKMKERDRYGAAVLLPYHFGRMTTYVGLGIIAGGVASAAAHMAAFRWISAGLLALAAVLFLMQAIPRLKPHIPLLARWESRHADRTARLAGPLFAAPFGWRGYGLGLMLGFIPCGLLYGALAAATATGDWLAGGFALAAFTLGTIPVLVGVGVLGQFAACSFNVG
ncbi:MAG: sulfite exporter TauE/SafE family protein [Rhodospirillaceae bacterium]